MKHNGVTADHRLVIMAKRLAGHAAHLEHIHKIGFIRYLYDDLQLLKIEILKGEIIVKNV